SAGGVSLKPDEMMKRAGLALVGLMLIGAPRFLFSQERGAGVSAADARAIIAPAMIAPAHANEARRVLVIGAHPDDEDTQLIAWLQRGGRAETAYLSLTRGDGGQNLIGNELGEALGIVRTEELLAARRVDGAHQFFTRAYDFGYSKTAAETFAHWPKDSLLNDVVMVVRAFRPHALVSIFSGTPRDGHGQHQVSAILARDAYRMAADTIRFPVGRFGAAWTPLKLYVAARFSPDSATLKFNVGEYNATLGRSYSEIAGESRSQHKSQGFGTLQRKGVVWDYLRREHTRVNEASPAKAERSIFDGLETIPAPVGFGDPERALIAAGVAVEAIADRQYVAIGDSARVTVTLFNRARVPVSISRPAGSDNGSSGALISVAPDSSYRWTTYMRGTEIAQPWWLATQRNGDLFSPAIGAVSEDEREKRDWLTAPISLAGAAPAIIRVPVVFRYADAVRGDVHRPLAVAPAISINLNRSAEMARANTPLDRFFNVTLRSAKIRSQAVTVSLALPAGLAADSATRIVPLDSAGTRTISFRVRGRLAPGLHTISATASVDGIAYNSGFLPIDYEHITPQRQYRPASLRMTSIDISVPSGLRVGYVPGVGDNVAPALAQLGIPVTVIDAAAIPTVDLTRFSTVVVGPRAYEANRELIANNPYLLDFARRGGTLVVQFGQYEMMRAGVMPYPITINRPHDRVAEENVPVTVLDPASPALRFPNRITAADFDGWVQERGLYMPRTFDEHYRALLAMNDPGEVANRGAVLVTAYGKGIYVYTTLAFFRQLPAGVSGGARLFVNLLSMKGEGSR
ncbi:MAG: PIG-L family deacetylase, partial [Gemmatimonadaceae bacterium]